MLPAMNLELNKATQLALDHACNEYRESLTANTVQLTDQIPYGFDPVGWTLFVISDARGVGSSRYVAVNVETGETKSMGRMGE